MYLLRPWCRAFIIILICYNPIAVDLLTEVVLSECPPDDDTCLSDEHGYQAIKVLHAQIDDDANGDLDFTETNGFVRDELKYEGENDRHKDIHGNDSLISIVDLWNSWKHSPAYNWTEDDVLAWLLYDIELPQYQETFKFNAVNGKSIPRLAANGQFITSILAIKNSVHKQKLSLKAMELVLFGPPKRHNIFKDVIVGASIIIAVGSCWLAYYQHQRSQKSLKKLMNDLGSLQTAEDQLSDVQKKLEEAQKMQQSVIEEKKIIENKMTNEIEEAKKEAERLKSSREGAKEDMERLAYAEEELKQVRDALQRAEYQLEAQQKAPLAELQQWLQMTYEIETLHCERKKEEAETQLKIAKDTCEKINKKRNAILGSFRIAHTNSMDDVDEIILSARTALEDVKTNLQERGWRWTTLEKICGFNIILNPGLPYLNSLLHSGSGVHVKSREAFNVDGTDDDHAATYFAVMNASNLGQNVYGTKHPQCLNMKKAATCSSLMKAGMQLSMIGIGTKNQVKRERSTNSNTIASAFSGTSTSLSPTQLKVSKAQVLRNRSAGTGLRSPSSAKQLHISNKESDEQNDSDSAKDDDITYISENGQCVPVRFSLGGDELCNINEENFRILSNSSRNSANKSTYEETKKNLQQVPKSKQNIIPTRPKQFPKSLSDHQIGSNKVSASPPHSISGSILDGETSSPESADGSISEDIIKPKHRKGKAFFKKLLRTSDKKL